MFYVDRVAVLKINDVKLKKKPVTSASRNYNNISENNINCEGVAAPQLPEISVCVNSVVHVCRWILFRYYDY